MDHLLVHYPIRNKAFRVNFTVQTKIQCILEISPSRAQGPVSIYKNIYYKIESVRLRYFFDDGSYIELVSKELNHLVAILYVYAGGFGIYLQSPQSDSTPWTLTLCPEMKCFYIWKNTMSNFIPTCVVQLDHINVQCVEGQWKQKNNMLVTGIFTLLFKTFKTVHQKDSISGSP